MKRVCGISLLQTVRIFTSILLFSTIHHCIDLRKQTFYKEPKDQEVVNGSKIILPCIVINQTYTVQWIKNNISLGTDRNLSIFEHNRYFIVGNEGDYSLVINPVKLEDDATYQCQVSYGPEVKQDVKSNPAHVSVLVPSEKPAILESNRFVATEDHEVKLRCRSYGGKPAAKIIWYDDFGNVVTEQLETSVERLPNGRFVTKSDIKFIAKKYHHNTQLTCSAKNIVDKKPLLAETLLLVNYAPRVVVSALPDKTINGRIPEGTQVLLECTVDANPSDLKYNWYINNELVTKDYITKLLIKKIPRKYNNSTFKCQVENSVGTSEDSTTLDVSYAPYFRTEPQSVQADLGSNVTLTCDVDGDPFPEVTWIYKASNKVVGTNPILTITVDNKSYFFGIYVCKATSKGFSKIQAEVTIYLKGRPVINSRHVQIGKLGDKVRIVCTAICAPPATNVTWMFNGKIIKTTHNYKSPGRIESILIINKSEDHHFGNYNCTVYNNYGTDSIIINLMPLHIYIRIVVSTIIAGAGTGTVIMMVCLYYLKNGRLSQYYH